MTMNKEAGKQRVNISRAKYDMVHQAILRAIRSQGSLIFQSLVSLIDYKLRNRFEGSVSWYVTTVKLDLEARDEIEHYMENGEQQLRLKEK